MIPSVPRTWLVALAIMLAVPVFATPTGGSGGGGITILPSARFAVAGTVLANKTYNDYQVTGLELNMPFSNATSVSLTFPGMATPAYTWVVTNATTFTLDANLMAQLWHEGAAEFTLSVLSADGLTFNVTTTIESEEKALATAVR